MAERFVVPANPNVRVDGWDALSASVDSLLQRRPLLQGADDSSPIKSYPFECIDRGVIAVPIYKIPLAPLRGVAFEQRLPQPSDARQYVHADQELQPIELYKVDNIYFVRDGHVRVANARLRGQLFLCAHVTECYFRSTVCSARVMPLLIAQERAAFFEQFAFPAGHDMYTVESRTLGNWLHLAQHLKSTTASPQCADVEIDLDALIGWYDRWYRPVARVIERCGVLADFPLFRELDVYLWAVERHDMLTNSLSHHEQVRLARRSVVALLLARRNQRARN